ncbi:MAG: DUF3316 domain-containing protein [Paludibacteraceae bacterium]|nr:DUF3316 domain-containing protein [Paludibacteraceae bacterium]
MLITLLHSLPAAATVEHENILSINYGGLWQRDMYLSPLLYKGMEIGITNEWWQTFNRNSNWKHEGQIHLEFGWTYSEPHNNLIYSIGINSGWGAFYSWKWSEKGWEIILGPYLDLDFMPQMHGKEVNKPFSMDLSVNICAKTGVSYHFKGKKSSYRLRYLIQTNLIGTDYMQDYWQSYYELTEGIVGNIRCSGPWNHRTLKHELTIDIQCPHSTWRLGIAHQYMEYGTHDMWFTREQVEAIIGTSFRYKTTPNKPLVLE